MNVPPYSTPEAFRQALETRLRADGTADLARRRQLVVFDRFLARVVDVLGDTVTLKGGLALELRLQRARTTKDVDLRMVGSVAEVLGKLQAAGRRDLGDYLGYTITPHAEQPVIDNPGLPYDGLRFRAEGKLAGKLYGQPFGVDVALGDVMHGAPDVVTASDSLGFAGIPPPTLRVYPIVTHIAEKLHAYTLPRAVPNSRIKDLPDLALLATVQPLAAEHLRAACARTFTFRDSHPLPVLLPEPPSSWIGPYAAMAKDNDLPWPALVDVTRAVRAFLDPVLARPLDATWQPETWTWT